jgi:DNA polymerase IV
MTSGDYASESEQSEGERPAKRPRFAGNSAFQCMEKHDGMNTDANPNAHTIETLEQMSKYYEGLGDKWRPRAYRMAIGSLRKTTQKIVFKEDAIQLPFVGTSLAAKIEEIALTNRLRKLEDAKLDPMDKAIKTFIGIYGVGLGQASRWVNEGHRTLPDLSSNNVKLTDAQRVGILYYEDLQKRIPRAEVAEHGRIVKEALAKFDSTFQVHIMGSYRRGASDSGDIDLLITKWGANIQNIRTTVIMKLIPKLTKQNFLTTGLATRDEHSGTKWHGCSCLPGSTTWRRIDFLMVPYDEMGAALIYFTGNDIFNRSLRLLASKKKMRLNQRGLYKNVMRGKGRQKITEGELVESKDEKKIFEILGVPYRPPEHRIC